MSVCEHCGAAIIERAALEIDGDERRVYRDGELVSDLRRRPVLWRTLELLARAPGTVFGRDQIHSYVHETPYHPLRHDPSVYTSVMRLRKLLGEHLIVTDGDGYRFEPGAGYRFR